MSGLWVVAFMMLWLLVIVLSVIVLGLLRRVAPLLVQLDYSLRRFGPDLEVRGLSAGEKVPTFEILDNKGKRVRLGDSLLLPAVFLFVDSGCEPCQQLTKELEEQASVFIGTRLYVVAENSSGYERLQNRGLTVLEQDRGQASIAFQQTAFPQAFAVDGERQIVASAVTDSLDDIKRLIREVGADGQPPNVIVQLSRVTEGEA